MIRVKAYSLRKEKQNKFCSQYLYYFLDTRFKVKNIIGFEHQVNIYWGQKIVDFDLQQILKKFLITKIFFKKDFFRKLMSAIIINKLYFKLNFIKLFTYIVLICFRKTNKIYDDRFVFHIFSMMQNKIKNEFFMDKFSIFKTNWFLYSFSPEKLNLRKH